MLRLNPGLFQHWQSDALTNWLDLIHDSAGSHRTRLELTHTRLDLINNSARSHPLLAMDLFHFSARSHNLPSARSHQHLARSHPQWLDLIHTLFDLIPHAARSHPLSARSHPHSARSHLHCKKSWRSSLAPTSGDAGPIRTGVGKSFRHPWGQFN